MVCNLCRAVLKKERAEKSTPKPLVPKHILIRAGAPSIELEPGKVFTIGRQSGCTLEVPSSRVSRLHAEIRWNDGTPILVDRGSSNGTYVGGKPVSEHALTPGDEVEIGPFHCVYRFDDPEQPRPGSADDPNQGTATIAASADFFSGRIGEAGLTEVIQGIEFNKKTGTLDVYARGRRGWIAVRDGVPLAAESDGSLDEEAALLLLGVRQGRFTFLPNLMVEDRRMRLTITGLLLEAGRRADESSAGKNPGDQTHLDD
jgi:hypothetical protein